MTNTRHIHGSAEHIHDDDGRDQDVTEEAKSGSLGSKISRVGNILIDGIAQIFLPVINALAAAGILKGLLAALELFGVLSKTSNTYIILDAMASALFYFLPVFIAYTTAKLCKTNRIVSMFLAVIILYPPLVEAMAGGANLTFLGIPVVNANYPSSVIPIIAGIFLLSLVEKWADRLLPDVVRGPLSPLVCLFIVGGLILTVVGPLGGAIGTGLAAGYSYLYGLSPIMAGTILSGIIQIMVIFGFHWGLIPIAISNIATHGSDTILAFFAPAVFAQAGATLAVFFKTKDREFRGVCVSAAISACFGITEPAMFGVTLPLKKPLVAVCVSGAVGGGIVGASGAAAMSFAFPGLATLPVFIGQGFTLMVVGCFVSMILAFVLTLILPFDARPVGQLGEKGEEEVLGKVID